MSELNFKVGQTVQIARRNLKGRVTYVGQTNFSPGKWIGVELDEDKGRNDGTVNGIFYFKCAPNRGLFVRPAQLLVVYCDAAAMSDATAEAETTGVAVVASISQTEIEAVEKSTNAPAVGNDDAPICSANLLKTTKIIQPKQAKQFFSSSSQLSLHVGAVASSSTLQATATVPVQPQAPKRSKTSVSPSESFCCSKRAASFVETGFLEILHPRFTPGHPQRSATFSMSTIGGVQVDQQRATDAAKIADLMQEIDAFRKQKAEDKRKLHELEKIRVQNEQLLEFKARIMEQHGILQRELQRSRQESRDANDVRGKYKRELDELAEGAEMLTLDKEMAEEKAETLQIELELAQERIEELTLDVEILRAENEDSLPVGNGRNTRKEDKQPTVGDLRKLEQYNHRLRETVVRLRDVLTQEKQNIQKTAKELETKYSEISELTKTKVMLSQRVDLLEMHIIDLKEQVDAALGAESMVESLADVKLELEERVKLLEEEVAELEALEEIHEQLVESNQELEVDLREEIDALNAAVKTLQHEKDNALETVYDRDTTIKKFRELVKHLNEQYQLKQDVTITSISDDMSTISNQEEPTEQSIDFNQVFSLTKAYGRSIDVQLNAIALKLSAMHVEYLLAFVPEDFMFRGGEHDVILVLLLMHRINEKVDILCNAINEKFPASCEFGKDVIFEGHSVHRFAFRSRSIYFLRSLKLVLQQLIFGLNHCDYEVCQHAAIYRGEIETQEYLVDELLRLLKRGLLDENSSINPIERMLGFFNTLHTNLIIPQDMAQLVDEHQLYLTLTEVFDVGLDCVNTNAELLHTIIQLGDENTESFWLMQFLMENMSRLKQKLRKLYRKLPTSSVTFNGMQREQLQRIQMTNEHFGRLINIVAASAHDATKDLSANGRTPDCSNDIAIDHEKLWRIIELNLSKLCIGEESKSSLTGMFQRCVQLIDEQISEFVEFMKVDESVRNTNVNTVFVRSSANTLLQRSTQVKQHFDDIKILRQALIDRDKEIKTLKYIAKMKQNDFSEMQIRKEIAERNHTKFLNDQTQTLSNISVLVENLEQQFCIKDVTFSKMLDTFESKLQTLEQTLGCLRNNFDIKTETANTSTDASSREIHMLTNCLRRERAERTRLQLNNLKSNFRNLEPIAVPDRFARPDIKELNHQLRMLKNDWILSHIAIKSNIKSTVAVRCNNLTRHIVDSYFNVHPHRAVPCDFSRFPTSEMCKILQNYSLNI